MSIDKAAKTKLKAERKRQEEVFTYRILIALSFVIVSILALMQIKRAYDSHKTIVQIHDAMLVVGCIGLGLAVVLIMFSFFLRKRNQKRGTLASVVMWSGLLCLVYGLMCLFIHLTYASQMTTLYIILPCLALLYLVYHIFQREFLITAMFISCSALGLWFFSRFLQDYGRRLPLAAGYAIFIGLIALYALFVLLLKRGDGALGSGARKLRLLPQGSRYRFAFAAAGLALAIVLATLFLGWAVAWYGIYAVFAYLFVTAVYYTVKMM